MKIQPANRRLGILLSGRGSNFEAIADRIASGKLNAEIAVVISNVETAPGLERARARGLHGVMHSVQEARARRVRCGSGRGALKEHVGRTGRPCRLHADFQPRLSRCFSLRYSEHSSVAAAVVSRNGRTATGVGVRREIQRLHGPLCERALDGGPIVQQAVVPVLDNDTVETLSQRILKEEHRIYSEAIDLVLSGKCEISGRRVLTDAGIGGTNPKHAG